MGIAEFIGLALLAVAVVLVLLAYRRVRLVRGGGVDVALRARRASDGRVSDGRGWHLGVARYRGDRFAWYRVSSLRSGPDRVLDRQRLVVVERREPTLPESYAVPPGSVVLHCRTADGELELAMGQGTLPGFLSWLESAPPGRGVPRAS